MTKTAFLSGIFAIYAAVMFAVASIPEEGHAQLSQVQSEQVVK